jgi:hypothetical protein
MHILETITLETTMITLIAPLTLALAIVATAAVPSTAEARVKASTSGANLSTVVQEEYMRGMRCIGMRCRRP